MSTWIRVTRGKPCPKCRHTDWCQVDRGGTVMCRRANDGTGREFRDTSGAPFWLYGHGTKPAPDDVPAPAKMPRAAVETLDQVYREWLGALVLNRSHRENLRGRGLADAEIDARGYRSWPTRGRAAFAKTLVDRFGPETCATIPGLYVKEEDDRRWWSAAGCAGLLIPVRDLSGRVQALKVRRDDPIADDEPRYTYISSASHHGPSCGSPAHVPLFNGDTRTVRVTEGHLKADVATVLTGILTLSVPGVGNFEPVVPILTALRPAEVRLAYDADAREKPAVARALAYAFRRLEAL